MNIKEKNIRWFGQDIFFNASFLRAVAIDFDGLSFHDFYATIYPS